MVHPGGWRGLEAGGTRAQRGPARKAKGLSQGALAADAGIYQELVSRIENGAANPELDALGKSRRAWRARAIGGMSPPTEAASVQAMNRQRKLFWAWCGFTFLWGLGWLASDGGFIALNFQFGAWRDAFLHLTLFLVVGIGVPLVLLLIGWIALRLRRKGAPVKFKKGQQS